MSTPPTPPPAASEFHPSRLRNGGRNFGHSIGYVLFMNVAHNLTQIFLGAVVISALIIPNVLSTSSKSFTQHIFLCTIGYFILMTQAIISFSPVGWASHLSYNNKKTLHQALHTLGSILVITGSIKRIADIGLTLDSGHAVCGFIALLLTIVSLICGILISVFPRQLNNKITKILHSCVGAITMAFAFITLVFGFHLYYRLVLGNANANLSIVLTVFALIGTCLMAMVRNYERITNE